MARHHVSLSRASSPVLCPAPAAGGAELCARLRDHGPTGVRGHPAAHPARRFRLGIRRRLLVSGNPLHRRRDARALPRALSLRLPARPRRLRGAMLLSLRGEPHSRTGTAAELPASRGADGSTRHCGGRGAGPHGNSERVRYGRVLRGADLHRRNLRCMAQHEQHHRGGAARRRAGGVHFRPGPAGAGGSPPQALLVHQHPRAAAAGVSTGARARSRRCRMVRAAGAARLRASRSRARGLRDRVPCRHPL